MKATIVITLVVRQTAEHDAEDVTDKLLDTGAIQALLNAHDFDEGPLTVLQASCRAEPVVELTARQRAVLARVAERYDSGHPPLFNTAPKAGTGELPYVVREKLEELALIESFDYAAHVHATRPNEAVPPFTYYRPTEAGRAQLAP